MSIVVPYWLAAVMIWIWIVCLLGHAFLFLAWVWEIRKAVNRTLDAIRLVDVEVCRLSGSITRKSS